MYSENSFNKHIAWLKFKRVFLLLFFSILGCIIGIILSSYLIELVMLSNSIRIPIIAGSTLLLFFFSLISTSKINNEIKDTYWKIDIQNKLNLISQKLDLIAGTGKLENLNEENQKHISKQVKFKKVASKKVY